MPVGILELVSSYNGGKGDLKLCIYFLDGLIGFIKHTMAEQKTFLRAKCWAQLPFTFLWKSIMFHRQRVELVRPKYFKINLETILRQIPHWHVIWLRIWWSKFKSRHGEKVYNIFFFFWVRFCIFVLVQICNVSTQFIQFNSKMFYFGYS